MKKLIIFLAFCAIARAVGTVQQSTQQVGNTAIYTVSLYWTGDAVSGTVPVTLIQSQSIPIVQGYRIVNMEAFSGTPTPTNGYGIALLDTAGVDVLAGAASSVISSSPQGFVGSPSSPPIFGSISLSITGQSVGGAKGTVFIYLAPFSQVIGLAPTAPSFPSQGANLFYASPNGVSGSPGFRAIAIPGDFGANAQGNGTKAQLSTGTTVSQDCVKYDANGNAVDAGAPCNNLPTGTQTQFLRIQPNTGNNTTLQFASFPEFFARDYNFPAQTPGGSLIIGSNTVTMTPCPQGLNGTDAGHSLYIQGGVGTAEAVLMTGGTCTSGLASGTVIFNAAGTHSGAWTIGSATGGIQEAFIQGGPRSVTLVSPGATPTFAQITMPISATLACALRSETFASASNNPGPCFLQFNQTSGDVIKATSGDTVIGLSIGVPNAYNGTPQNVTAVDFTGGVGVKIISTEIYGAFIGVNFTQVNVATARDIYIANPFTNGIGFNCVTFDDIVIDGSQANGAPVSGAMKYSVFVSDSAVAGFGGGMQLTNNDFFQSQFGLFIQSTTANGISQVLSSNEFYNHCTNTCIVATATSPGFARSIQINNVNIEVSQGDGIQVGGGTGNVDSVTITGGSINNNLKNGIHLETGALHTAITGVKVAQNSTSSPSAFSGLTVDAGVSFWNVSGGWFGPAEGGPTEPAVQAYAVNVASGASDNYSINGVYVGGNATGTINDLGTGTHKVIAHNLGSFSVTQSGASATGQTAAIAPVNLLCNGAMCAAGQYLICYYLGVTATGSGNVAINLQWNDGAATQTFTSATVSAAALNFGDSCLSIRSAGSTNLLYSTNYTTTGTYQVYVSVLRQQ